VARAGGRRRLPPRARVGAPPELGSRKDTLIPQVRHLHSPTADRRPRPPATGADALGLLRPRLRTRTGTAALTQRRRWRSTGRRSRSAGRRSSDRSRSRSCSAIQRCKSPKNSGPRPSGSRTAWTSFVTSSPSRETFWVGRASPRLPGAGKVRRRGLSISDVSRPSPPYPEASPDSSLACHPKACRRYACHRQK
jgi:hypothetical protein